MCAISAAPNPQNVAPPRPGTLGVAEFPAMMNLTACPSLAASRRYSLHTIAALGSLLDRHLAPVRDAVATVAAAGSLGRLEAAAGSDVDWIVVLQPGRADAAAAVRAAIASAAADVTALGLKPPKADGIYAEPRAREHFVDPSCRGSLDESPALFGSRMQILLDARAVHGRAAFDALRAEILHWYGPTPPAATPAHLYDDILRYLHAYRAWQRFKFTRADDDGWYLRQAKLHGTRIPTFAGLMLLLAESECHADPHAWLRDRLDLTPLERLDCVISAYDPPAMRAILADYAALHATLTDPQVRHALVAASPPAATATACDPPPVVAALSDRATRLADALVRFVLARVDDWPREVFRYWLL